MRSEGGCLLYQKEELFIYGWKRTCQLAKRKLLLGGREKGGNISFPNFKRAKRDFRQKVSSGEGEKEKLVRYDAATLTTSGKEENN